MRQFSQKITDKLHYIGTNDRITEQFENMWPLPDGVAYNSYIIKGSKNILLDSVKSTTIEECIRKLDEVLEGEELHYIIVHHMEPDHSSGIPTLLLKYPNCKLIANKRAVKMLDSYYGIKEDEIILVDDGETLELGDTKLTFYHTPMVHWPESMVSFEEETGTLFSQDIFGAFGTLDGAIYDDEVEFDRYYLEEMSRYYINIVGKYSGQALKALGKLGGLDIKMICPDHGPIWRNNIEKVIQIYTDLANQKTEDGVAIIFGSIYGNTERMAQLIAKGVAEEGLTNIRMHDVAKTPQSYLLADCWRYKGIILISCSYDKALFPPMSFLTSELKHQKMKNNIWGIAGSYSWNGGALKGLKEFVEGEKLNVLPLMPEVMGAGSEKDFEDLINLGKMMAKAVKEGKVPEAE